MPSNHLLLYCPLLLLPSVFSTVKVFLKGSALHFMCPKYWRLSFSISSTSEYLGSDFLYDWLFWSPFCPSDCQESSPALQFKSINSLAFSLFMAQISNPYMNTGQTIPLTIWTFVRKVIFLLFNILSRLVIAFIPRRKCLLISWLQSLSAVILKSKDIKSETVAIFSLPNCHDVMGPDAMIFDFWMLSFKLAFSLSCFIFIKWLFNSSSLSAIMVVSSAYVRLLIFLPAVLDLACAASSLAF